MSLRKLLFFYPKHVSAPIHLEEKTPLLSSSKKPVLKVRIQAPYEQLIDRIDFEKKLANSQIINRDNLENQLVNSQIRVINIEQKVDENVAIAEVDKVEKRKVATTFYISTTGFGFAITTGIMSKFTASTIAGGAGFVMGATALLWATAGGALLALLFAYYVRNYSIKNTLIAIGKIKINIKRMQLVNEALDTTIREKLVHSVKLLLKMQLALNSLPTAKECKENDLQLRRQLETEIKRTMFFLTNDPNHPHLEEITDEASRNKAKARALKRNITLKDLVTVGAEILTNHKTTLTDQRTEELIHTYLKQNTATLSSYCFPRPSLSPPPPIKTSQILNKSTPQGVQNGMAILGVFTGSLSLCFTCFSLIMVFSGGIAIAFPPIYVMLGIAVGFVCYIGKLIYQGKKQEAERRQELGRAQEQNAYLEIIHTSLTKKIEYLEKLFNLEGQSEPNVTRPFGSTISLRSLLNYPPTPPAGGKNQVLQPPQPSPPVADNLSSVPSTFDPTPTFEPPSFS